MPVAWMHADMLEYPMQTITNTVNCVGAMGKGLALQFKRKFPMYNDDYILKCRDSDYSPGINAGASMALRPTACNPKLSMFNAAFSSRSSDSSQQGHSKWRFDNLSFCR